MPKAEGTIITLIAAAVGAVTDVDLVTAGAPGGMVLSTNPGLGTCQIHAGTVW